MFMRFAYFKDHCKLIEVDLSKQKALDADLRAIQQIVFQEKAGKNQYSTLFLRNQK